MSLKTRVKKLEGDRYETPVEDIRFMEEYKEMENPSDEDVMRAFMICFTHSHKVKGMSYAEIIGKSWELEREEREKQEETGE